MGEGVLPRLPRPVWVVLAADTVSAVGSGLTLPFLLVYLNRVHGFSLGLAGAAIAVLAVGSLAGNPIGGALADRIGPQAALSAGLAIAGAGAAGLAGMSAPWHGFAAAGLSGFGVAVAWPAQDALLARLVGEDQRPAVYGLRHATLNLGLGVGALLAAVILDPDRAGSFATLYWLDAVTFLLPIPLVLGVTAVPPADPVGSGEDTATGYRAVLHDRAFLRLWVLVAVLVTVGYGQFNSAFPAFATGPGGVEPRLLGLVFTANTVTVVLAQLVAVRLLAGYRRTRLLMLLAGLWAASWMLVVGGPLDGLPAVAGFALAAVVFGLGETLLAPTVPALVNDLAPDHLRGRYNGASTLAYTTGFVTGPLLAGFMLGHGAGVPLFVVLAAGCAGCAVLARGLENHLPERVNHVSAARTAAAPPAPALLTDGQPA
jgi:MFS family permease